MQKGNVIIRLEIHHFKNQKYQNLFVEFCAAPSFNFKLKK